MATRLQLLIDGDASGARRALDDVAGGVDQAQSKLGKFNGAMSKATVPAAATVASLAAVGKASFDSASALEQSASAGWPSHPMCSISAMRAPAPA